MLEPIAGKAAEIETVLGLLEAGLSGGVAIIGRPLTADRLQVADAYRRADLIGSEIAVLPALLPQASTLLPTEGLRLPLAWTLACGRRPTFFASVAVPGQPLQLVAAACGNLPPNIDQVTAAAGLVGQLLRTGEVTHVERDTSRRIASLVQNLPVTFVFVDSRGLEIFMNEQARDLLQLHGEAQPHAVAAALKGVINERGTEGPDPALAADPKTSLSFNICRSERHFKVESDWIDDHVLSGRVWTFTDVTELEHARREAEIATAAKSAFLANMSHEIRTPLNGVMGFAELLLAGELRPEQQRQASVIFESAQTLLTLLNDILDVSKFDAGQMEVVAEPFDLWHQIRQCIQLMGSTAERKGLHLSLELDPALPQHIVGDGLRLRQVLLNLLGNAIKFTEHGSVAVEAVVGHAGGRRIVELRVVDTGVGIPLARQASVFEEFVQAEASISRRFGGSGLGLSISRRLVGLMGGDITLQSGEGQGTTVSVRLPLNEVLHPMRRSSDQAGEVQERGTDCSATARGTSTILLVEDLDINQELIRAMLGQMGYAVEIASDGAEAIELCRQLKAKPNLYDLILMDVQMPVVDGLTATRAIRTLGGRASEIPILALTANAFASEVQESRDAGMNEHLSKPISMAALRGALSRWLSDKACAGPRRRHDDQPKSPLAAKFAERMAEYAARLDQIRSELAGATGPRHCELIAEAEGIAHRLAGTAAMFDRRALGELAGDVEDCLKGRSADDGETASPALRIKDLAEALRQAA